MSLRLRILLGYGYLVALLLLATGSAIFGFFQLSGGVGVMLEENLVSVGAAMAMIEALERQDSATLSALIDPSAEGPLVDLATYQREFREALERAASNLTEEGEDEVVAALRRDFDEYRRARDALIEERPERLLAGYNSRVALPFTKVKSEALRLLALNQEAMARTDRAMRDTALRSGTWLGFVVAMALISFVFLSRAMQRSVMGRLQRLETGIQAVAAGRQRRLAEEGRDELGIVSRRVNALLDQYEELERGSHGRLAQERRLVLALVRACGEGNVLLGLSGEVLAGSVPDQGLATRLTEWIRAEGREHVEAAGQAEATRATVSAGGALAELELLLAPPARPVGWLARISAAQR
jgi:HAMP domain-containing protein